MYVLTCFLYVLTCILHVLTCFLYVLTCIQCEWRGTQTAFPIQQHCYSLKTLINIITLILAPNLYCLRIFAESLELIPITHSSCIICLCTCSMYNSSTYSMYQTCVQVRGLAPFTPTPLPA